MTLSPTYPSLFFFLAIPHPPLPLFFRLALPTLPEPLPTLSDAFPKIFPKMLSTNQKPPFPTVKSGLIYPMTSA